MGSSPTSPRTCLPTPRSRLKGTRPGLGQKLEPGRYQTAGNDGSGRKVGKDEKAGCVGADPAFSIGTPTYPASQSRSPHRAFPDLFPARYATLNPFCKDGVAAAGSEPATRARGPRLLLPALWGSRRRERALPTRSIRGRESHPLLPTTGLGALGPYVSHALPAPPGGCLLGTPAATYQAGRCGKCRQDVGVQPGSSIYGANGKDSKPYTRRERQL